MAQGPTIRRARSGEIIVPKGYELIDGRLVEKPCHVWASWHCGVIAVRLMNDPAVDDIAWTFGPNLHYRCFPGERVRNPDTSVILKSRLPALSSDDARERPDLVVEMVGPGEQALAVDDRVEDFLSVGTPLIWVVNPARKQLLIHRSDGSVTKLHASAILTGEEVLPGFSCPVRDLFPPTPFVLLSEHVYPTEAMCD
jgi:Uma2 family endonuclease